VVAHPATAAAVEGSGVLDDFADPALQHLCRFVLEKSRHGAGIDTAALLNEVPEGAGGRLLAEAAYAEAPAGPVNKILTDCIRDIRLKKNAREYERITALMKQAEAVRDEHAARQHQRASQDLLQDKRRILSATYEV
jgi:hypothetical protein